MDTQEDSLKFKGALTKFIAFGSILTGVLFIPYLFGMLFSFGELHVFDIQGLIYTSATFIIFGILLLVFKKSVSMGLLMMIFSVLIFIWSEFAFRGVANLAAEEKFKNEMNFKSNVTYTDNQAYGGSPFIHFLGNPNTTLEGNLALKASHPFNNFGFCGDDFFYYKPSKVIRIACIGESTTADGYPKFLENYLNQNNVIDGYRFEVYNFGHAYWTTAHSLSNFMLNILDFSPDILVIHHGWNEAKVRNYDEREFRGDYSHRFKAFNHPVIPDRYIIRTSAIYRYFKFLFDKSPVWMSLAGSIETGNYPEKSDFRNKKELIPFERNITNIVRTAHHNNMKVIFATIPHSTDPNIAMREGVPNIIQCNSLTREIYTRFQTHVSFVDLDSILTGKRNDIFVDLAHINDEGRELKGEYIGKSVISLCDSTFINGIKVSDKGFGSQSGIDYYIDRMKKDLEWQKKDLIPKANKLGISLDSMMVIDAIYMVEMDK